MKFILFSLIGFFIAIFMTHSKYNESGNVLLFDESNFDEALSEFPTLVLEFYRNGCPACEAFEPEYSQAAGILKAYGIPVGRINVETHPESQVKFRVNNYPTVVYVAAGQHVQYPGTKTAQGVLSWVKSKVFGKVVPCPTVDDLERKISVERVSAVLFDSAGSSNYAVFEDVASDVEDVAFLLCEDLMALDKFNVSHPQLTIFKHFDEGRNDYQEEFKRGIVKKFINDMKLPAVLTLDTIGKDYVFVKKNDAVILFRADSEGSRFDGMLAELGKSLKGEFAVVYADLTDESVKYLGDKLGLTPTDMPIVLIFDSTSDVKYLVKAPLTFETVLEATKKFTAGELEAFYRSEETPANDYENGIKIITGKTFEADILTSGKNVMLEFYAPWCTHCKELAPKYEKVAKYYEADDSIVLAKIDGSKNDVKGHQITGYPSILFFPANTKEWLKYGGERNEKGMIKFINENRSN